MNSVNVKIIAIVLSYALSAIFGIWLSLCGKPLNKFILYAHKLISILAITFSVIVIFNFTKIYTLQSNAIILLAISSLFIIVEVITGGIVVSSNKQANNIILHLHRGLPLLIVIFLTLSVYFIAYKS